jgi:RNA polymerase sigma-70 factor (ECF subfamily)
VKKVKNLEPKKKSDRVFVEELWNSNKALMYSTALKYIQDSEIIGDVLQESIEKIIKKTSLLRTLDRCALTSYIVLIVKSVSINHINHSANIKKHIVDLDEGYTLEDFPANIEPLDDRVIRTEQRQALFTLLERLPEPEQMLLQGKYVFEMSNDELAEIFGISCSSVRMRLTRARKHAKFVLESESNDNGKS